MYGGHGLQLRRCHRLKPVNFPMHISVIIPTLNEAASIGALVHFITEHGKGVVKEVIVADANSTDDTASAARRAGATVLLCKEKCRAAQMNQAAAVASGDILYFVHADVQLLPSFTSDILQAVEAGADAGCYRYRFDSGKRLLRINAWFTRFGSLVCRGGDQTLFIKRSLFEALNGFDEFYTVMEDYDMVRRIEQAGRFVIIQKSITVSARKYEHNSWLRVQVANFMVFSMYLLGRSPERMRRMYGRMLRSPTTST